jgi:hypothetical protein
MPRAIVSRKTIDTLIRAKVRTLETCSGIEALPVVHDASGSEGCNWKIPGWVGEADSVGMCLQKLSSYLAFLRTQFDIAAENNAGA